MINNKFAPKKSKYRSRRCEADGHKFDSEAEREFYYNIRFQEQQGLCKLLELQPKVYMTKARILYKPDFKVDLGGKIVFIDVKGVKTRAFGIKLRLWKFYGEGILRLVQKSDRFGFKVIKEVGLTHIKASD